MKKEKDLTTEERISVEKARLEKIYANIEADRKVINEKLIDNAAFMAVTLETLQKRINTDGAVIECVNGNGFTTISENPAQKSYNVMINRYAAVTKQLTDLLPGDNKSTVVSEEENMFLQFVKGAKT